MKEEVFVGQPDRFVDPDFSNSSQENFVRSQTSSSGMVFRNKLDENGIVSRNKARLMAQGYNQQEGIDYDETYAPIARIFFNQSKYIKEMLKMFELEDSKPTKTPMSMEIKLTENDEADSVDSSKYPDPETKKEDEIKFSKERKVERERPGSKLLGLSPDTSDRLAYI
nr:hypothetical protein [Tanacetum cinerariifolium]